MRQEKNTTSIRRLLFILVISLYPIVNYAQLNKIYSISNGLSSTNINKVIQDKQGYIWIATDNGLNKFDGERFTHFKTGDERENGLTDNLITALLEDSKGKLWIGTHSGLWSLTPKTEKFTKYPISSNNSLIFNFHVSQIVESINGNILVSTSGMSIATINKKTNHLEALQKLRNLLPTPYINNLFTDSKGNIFISIENNGLYLFDTKTNKFQHYTKNIGGLRENQIMSMCEDKKKNMYVGTNGGLYAFNYVEKIFQLIPGSEGLNITDLFLSNDGKLNIGTDGSGIYRMATDGKLSWYLPSNNLPRDVINKIQSLMVDKDGNIWCGIKYKGLVMIGKPSNQFEHFEFKKSFASYSEICVFSAYSNEKEVWFGTDGDGILIYNRKEEQPNNFKQILPNKKILSILEDKDGTIWLGTWNDGLLNIDKRTHSIKQQFKPDLTNPKSIKSDRIWCIAQDLNGHLWLGTSGDGICRMDIAKGEFTNFSSPEYSNGRNNTICNNWVNCILVDHENNVWAGTSNGISKLNLSTMKFSNFFFAQGDEKGIIVKAMTIVGNQIWVGTGYGILIYDNKTKGWSKIKEKELAIAPIYTLVTDNNGFVWVTGLNKIFKVNPKDHSAMAFSANEGIQITEFQRNAGCKAPNGIIYFGGINGSIGLNPKIVGENKKLDNLIFTELLMFNKPVFVGQKSGGKPIIESDINSAEKITMAYNDCFFTVRFKILNYINSDQVTYTYKMEGYDNNWQDLPPNKDKSATYTNLSWGEYQFIVKAEMNNLLVERSITVVVLPPWWATIWMKMLYLILLALALYMIYQYNKGKQQDKLDRERLKHLNELNEMKLQFFINISHEIRSPITLILNPLERLLKDATDLNRDLFHMMYRNAQRLLNLVNQLMDIRKIDKGQFSLKVSRVEILAYLRNIIADFQFYTDEKQIELNVHSDLPEIYAYIDPIHFEKVIINLLSNAFKFSPPESEITISARIPENDLETLRIEVIDSGTGIEPDMLESIFDRFVQSYNPVPKNAGTGIGLHLCRLLINLHHGIITAENRTDSKGAILRIEIPLGKEHYNQDEIAEYQDTAITENTFSKETDSPIEWSKDIKKTKSEKSAKKKMTVHIVEDDNEIRSYLVKELSDTYHVVESITASTAVKSIFTSPPDLIISDVMMPGLDGIAFSKMVRENYLTSHIPIILLTAKNTMESIKEGLEAGADEYMIKPFNTEILKTRVEKLLEMRKNLEYHYGKEANFEMPDIEISSHDDKLMKKINDVLTNNLSDERLNVTFLCNEVGISRVHLNRKMRELVNISAQDYIRIFRLKYAATLLKDKKLSVAEVAYAIGFSNPSHFTYRFRMFYGVTPTEYMEKGL